MSLRRWWGLSLWLRSAVLGGTYVAATTLTTALGWRSTPYAFLLPVLALTVALATLPQAFAMTALVVGTTTVLALYPRPTFSLEMPGSPYTQLIAAEVFVALTAVAAAVLLHQHRTEREQGERLRYEFGVVRALGNYALTRLAREDLVRALAMYMCTMLDADNAVVLLADPDRQTLRGYVDWGDGRAPEAVARPVAGTLAGDVLRTGRSRLVADAEAEPRLTLAANGWMRSLVAVAIPLGGLPIGVLYLGRNRTGAFAAGDVHLVETLARAVAVPLYASRPAAPPGTEVADAGADPAATPPATPQGGES